MPRSNQIWFPKSQFTQADVDEIMAMVAEIAASHGLTVQRGKNAGKGNIAELISAIVVGELIIVGGPYEEMHMHGPTINELREIAENASHYTGEMLKGFIDALEDGFERQAN